MYYYIFYQKQQTQFELHFQSYSTRFYLFQDLPETSCLTLTVYSIYNGLLTSLKSYQLLSASLKFISASYQDVDSFQ